MSQIASQCLAARRVLFAMAALALLGACANIPPGAESANTKVSDGIERMALDTSRILDAYRRSLRLAVEEQFSDIHAKAEKNVRYNRSVPKGTALNLDQQQEVTGQVLLYFQDAHRQIDATISNLRAVFNRNATTIKAANDDITKLLGSAGRVGLARAEILKLVQDLVPLPDVRLPEVFKIDQKELPATD